MEARAMRRLYAQFVLLDGIEATELEMETAPGVPERDDRSQANPFSLPAGREFWEAPAAFWTRWRRRKCRCSPCAWQLQRAPLTAGVTVDLATNGRRSMRQLERAPFVPLRAPGGDKLRVRCCCPPHALRAAADSELRIWEREQRARLLEAGLLLKARMN